MLDEQRLWERIRRHAGEPFEAKTGKSFTLKVPGNYLRVAREGEKINRSLSRTNFMRAATAMPADGPGAIKDRQGSAYTWAVAGASSGTTLPSIQSMNDDGRLQASARCGRYGLIGP